MVDRRCGQPHPRGPRSSILGVVVPAADAMNDGSAAHRIAPVGRPAGRRFNSCSPIDTRSPRTASRFLVVQKAPDETRGAVRGQPLYADGGELLALASARRTPRMPVRERSRAAGAVGSAVEGRGA